MKKTSYQIEVDEEVFAALQQQAEPFVDTPNTVLRRLLGFGKPGQGKEGLLARGGGHMATQQKGQFQEKLLTEISTERFRVKAPFRLMFESESHLVYVQNFDQPSPKLWYRVNENAWKILRQARKNAVLCLANPAESFAYVIPVSDISKQVADSDYERSYLEINIDVGSSRWIELDWNIDAFLTKV